MLTVILDVQLTRRKRAHIVVDPDGETQFSASAFSDVLGWFVETDVSAFNVQTNTDRNFQLAISTTKQAFLDFGKVAALP